MKQDQLFKKIQPTSSFSASVGRCLLHRQAHLPCSFLPPPLITPGSAWPPLPLSCHLQWGDPLCARPQITPSQTLGLELSLEDPSLPGLLLIPSLCKLLPHFFSSFHQTLQKVVCTHCLQSLSCIHRASPQHSSEIALGKVTGRAWWALLSPHLGLSVVVTLSAVKATVTQPRDHHAVMFHFLPHLPLFVPCMSPVPRPRDILGLGPQTPLFLCTPSLGGSFAHMALDISGKLLLDSP